MGGSSRPGAAALVEGLCSWAERDPKGTHPSVSSSWYLLALRPEADRAEHAAARERSRRWPRPDGGPPQFLSSWTDLLPRPRQARYPRVTPTCSSPELSSPDSSNIPK